jgi:hypothetical protein
MVALIANMLTIIVTKDIVLYPMRHIATSQSAMCHNKKTIFICT